MGLFHFTKIPFVKITPFNVLFSTVTMPGEVIKNFKKVIQAIGILFDDQITVGDLNPNGINLTSR